MPANVDPIICARKSPVPGSTYPYAGLAVVLIAKKTQEKTQNQ